MINEAFRNPLQDFTEEELRDYLRTSGGDDLDTVEVVEQELQRRQRELAIGWQREGF